ncbi:MAG: AI-2E family transporter [Clostridia bacterium]|nr:AI-2E family transporter [Clostridia bacterium]
MERGERQQKMAWLICCIALVVVLINGKQIIRSITDVLALFSSFGIGISIAFVFNRPYNFLRRKYHSASKMKKKTADILAIFSVYLSVAAVLAAIIGIVIPQLTGSVKSLIENAGMYLQNLQQELDMVMQMLNLPLVDLSNITDAILQGIVQLNDTTGALFSTILSATGTVVSSLVTGLIAIVFSIYLLAGKERILRQANRLLKAYLPEKVYAYLLYLQKIAVESFENYIVGQSIEAVILGSLCFIGMLVLRLDYASLISVVVAVTALIPILGAYIGGAVALVLLLIVSPWKAGIFLVFYVILQQIENKIIYPRVVGSRIGLSGIWVLLAITVGTKIGGIFGTIVGVPVTSILYTLLKNGVIKREQQLQATSSSHL